MADDVLLAWSGGKDSALALHELKKRHNVRALLTTITEGFDRISMHGVRRILLHAQAASLGVASEIITIPKDCTNVVYEARMRSVLERYKTVGVTKVAFGDLFLEDIRAYREEKLAQIGMQGVFPLWLRNTSQLAREFVHLGFRAIVCCVDPRKLAREFCGMEYDSNFIDSLPDGVDPSGENGEFHSFAFAGPIFRSPIRVTRGESVERDGFYFVDLIPASFE
jgi:uncharacterized protein (TIGR00290 family)